MSAYENTLTCRDEVAVLKGSLKIGLLAALAGGLMVPLHAQLPYVEGFNDDGDGTRYFTEGRDVIETGIVDQEGPVYWAHNFDVSFVGVPAGAPARRAVYTWHHDIDSAAVTEEALELFDSVVAWLLDGQANATVLFSPSPAGTGDDVLVQRLEELGHTVQNDDADLPAASAVDLVIHSSNGTIGPSRFTTYPVPLLSYNAADHDDELISSIGDSGSTFDPGEITISDPDHPAADGLTGPFTLVTEAQPFDTVGSRIPDGATTLATFAQEFPAPVTNLDEVDEMISGSLASTTTTGTAPSGDLNAGAGANWTFDHAVPGTPSGGFAVLATGQIEVHSPGTYGFALSVDDGARLRIDVNGDGLDASDDVIVADRTGGVQDFFADVTFDSSGTFDFEWASFNDTGNYGAELSVTFEEGAGTMGPIDFDNWTPLGEHIAGDPVTLVGEMDLTTYMPDLPPITEENPLVVLIEHGDDGGQVLGGGGFSGFEGDGFFAGAGLNKFGSVPKSLTLQPVDVSGEENVQLTVALAATDLDFETSDFFDILVDIDDTGPAEFTTLAHFTAPSEDDKFITDGTTRLGIGFQDLTYDVPPDATQLVVRFETTTTWWNEIVALDNVRITAGDGGGEEPTINIARDGEDLVIEFTGVLQSAEQVEGPYSEVEGRDTLTLEPATQGSQQFFRAVGE